MPLDKLALILAIVIAAAGGTIWLAKLALPGLQSAGANWVAVIPVVLVAYVIWRVIAQRFTTSKDAHHDRIQK